jgi:hypothetical protein
MGKKKRSVLTAEDEVNDVNRAAMLPTKSKGGRGAKKSRTKALRGWTTRRASQISHDLLDDEKIEDRKTVPFSFSFLFLVTNRFLFVLDDPKLVDRDESEPFPDAAYGEQ